MVYALIIMGNSGFIPSSVVLSAGTGAWLRLRGPGTPSGSWRFVHFQGCCFYIPGFGGFLAIRETSYPRLRTRPQTERALFVAAGNLQAVLARSGAVAGGHVPKEMQGLKLMQVLRGTAKAAVDTLEVLQMRL